MLNKNNILFILVSILLLFVVSRGCEEKYVPTSTISQNSIDSINNVLHELNNQQILLDSTLNLHQRKIDSIYGSIHTTHTNITNIKNYYESKINSARNFSDDELVEFFTNRYK